MQTLSKLPDAPIAPGVTAANEVAIGTPSATHFAAVTVLVEQVSKQYRLQDHYAGLRDRVGQLGRRLRGRAEPEAKPGFFDALKDISFQVHEGEALGLIGHNGAGKTTMLKLLSRITRPTTGRLHLQGRSSSLIELGAGFHPDLSGRENVFLNGVILGLSRDQIKRKFDDIVAFAELEKFIDMPVKRYSSGMYARLGFSVAAHVSPDIMLIDEVLSVGDASFQRRCYDFVHNFVRSGKTTVFVSHNLFVIEQLCDRVIWLDHGRIALSGTPNQVLPAYLDNQDEKALAATKATLNRAQQEDDEINKSAFRILDVALTNAQGEPCEAFCAGEDMVLNVHYRADQPIQQPHFVLGIVEEGSRPLFLASMLADGHTPTQLSGEGVIKCRFKSVPLAPRTYAVWGEVWAADRAGMLLRWQQLGAVRIVEDGPDRYLNVGKGGIRQMRAESPIRVPYDWEW